MADEKVLDPDVPSQASTNQDEDDSFSDSDFAETEPIKGRKVDKAKKPKYKTFEEDEETSTDSTPDKGKLTKRPSFFNKIGFQKPKIKEKEKDKDKQKEKQKPKLKDKGKENKELEKAKGTKSKDRGRSWSKGKENKEKDKTKKLSSSALETQATPQELRPVFGVDLALAVERSNPHDGIQLPLIVRDCIDYIEANGMCVEGIYRLSGVKSRIDALRTAYDTAGDEVDLTDQDPHIIAGLLKLFLRELPEPVLTQRIMLALEEASKNPDNKIKIQMFRGAINELSVCNKTLLSWVIVHMAHVIGNEVETKMNLQNISIVLCPTLHMSHRVLNVFFSNWRDIFGDVVLKKVKRRLRWRSSRTSIELPDSSFILEEELRKQEAILNEMHERVNKGTADKNTEEQLWEVQRIVTQLKRKIRVCRKSSETAISPSLKEKVVPEENSTIETSSEVLSEAPLKEETEGKVNEDDKSDDGVFIETVAQDSEKLEEKVAEKECSTNAEESCKTEIEVKPDFKENTDVVIEEHLGEVAVVEKDEVVEKVIDDTNKEQVEAIEENASVIESDKKENETNTIENNIEESIVESKEVKDDITEASTEPNQMEDNDKEEEDEEIIQLLLITQAETLARQQELKKIQSELQKRIEAERSDIAHLRQKLAEEERNESLQLRPSSFESSSNSSDSSESEDEEELMEILRTLTKKNEELEATNNELVMSIHSERERCVDLRVQMTTLILKQDLANRRSFSGPAPLETDL